jgi:sensor histidine kinase YesM
MKYRKQLNVIAHLLFWMVSICGWNILFNPGVETSGAIKGLQDYWPELLLLNCIFYIYCLMPFIWLIRGARKWLKIAVTIVFLIPACYLVFEYLHPAENRDDLSLFTDFFLSGFLYVLIFHLTIAAAVYYNLYVLVRKYLKDSKFLLYLISVTCLTVVTAVINYALFDYGLDLFLPSLYFISYFEIYELILIAGVYLVLTTVVFLIWQYAILLISNRDKAQNELFALKAQINPHFLFNNLNTIYSMAVQNDEKTKDVILQLSDFLRYVLYDTSSEFISLEKEVDIIRTYVDLQKSRIDPTITQVELTQEGNLANKMIAPLLLLPLAENCFKHGSGKAKGIIQIGISVNGNHLRFTTDNPVAPREKSSLAEQGGIGISNVEKRLNLLYPERYSLHYGQQAGKFKVELKIEI